MKIYIPVFSWFYASMQSINQTLCLRKHLQQQSESCSLETPEQLFNTLIGNKLLGYTLHFKRIREIRINDNGKSIQRHISIDVLTKESLFLGDVCCQAGEPRFLLHVRILAFLFYNCSRMRIRNTLNYNTGHCHINTDQ